MITRHRTYKRINVRTGEIEVLPFASIDGVRFGWDFDKNFGYRSDDALLIVNRWNYVGTLQPRFDFAYWLHKVEGAQ